MCAWLGVNLGVFSLDFLVATSSVGSFQDAPAELRQGGRLRFARSLRDYVIQTASVMSAPETPAAERLCMRMDAGGGGLGPARVRGHHNS